MAFRYSFLLATLGLFGCSARVADDAPEAGVIEGSAVCTTGERPVEPAEPKSACFEELVGEGSVVVSTTRRATATVEGLQVLREDTFNEAGVLSKRVVRKTRGELLMFESTEHLLLSKADSLPYTYGEAATFSITYGYDSAGRVVRKALDRAMDGVIDTEELTAYHPNGEVADRTSMADGKLTRRALFDDAGNPLSEVDAGGYGRRWVYAAGLLVREEQLAGGVVTQRSEWTMRAKKQPLRLIVLDVSKTSSETKVGEATWTYSESGVLTATDGWAIVSGTRRVKHTEFDARGRATLFVEENEEPSCRRYQQVSEYGEGEEPTQQTTTCDGRAFARLRTTFDAKGKPTRVERGFYGNPRSVTEDVNTYAYDTCGRLVMSEMMHNGTLQRRESYSFDARGRLAKVETTDRTGAAGASSLAYDASGRVVAMDGKRWSYDADGRVTAVEYDGGILSGDRRIRVIATRFRHSCGGA